MTSSEQAVDGWTRKASRSEAKGVALAPTLGFTRYAAMAVVASSGRGVDSPSPAPRLVAASVPMLASGCSMARKGPLVLGSRLKKGRSPTAYA